MQCAQLKRSMSKNDLCLAVAVKALDSLILKAQNRLVPALAPAYHSSLGPCAAGGSSTHPGVICLERCRDAVKDALQLRPLAAALQAKPSTKCSGIHLLQAARSAREADGVMGPPNVYEMALKRDGFLAFNTGTSMHTMCL